jgi:predicted methyltransferase
MNTAKHLSLEGLLRRRFAAGLLAAFLFASGLLVFTPARARSAQDDGAKRDVWQQPERVMDALGLRSGSRVADVGCGEGYFVMHLARRVGPSGIVYAVDLDESALEKVRDKAKRAGLENVRIVRSKPDNPMLPANDLDAVLMVNAYHEMREHDAMLQEIFVALRRGGRLGIIDAAGRDGDSRAALMRAHTMSESLVREDAEKSGFTFARKEPGFERADSSRRNWFFLVFFK